MSELNIANSVPSVSLVGQIKIDRDQGKGASISGTWKYTMDGPNGQQVSREIKVEVSFKKDQTNEKLEQTLAKALKQTLEAEVKTAMKGPKDKFSLTSDGRIVKHTADPPKTEETQRRRSYSLVNSLKNSAKNLKDLFSRSLKHPEPPVTRDRSQSAPPTLQTQTPPFTSSKGPPTVKPIPSFQSAPPTVPSQPAAETPAPAPSTIQEEPPKVDKGPTQLTNSKELANFSNIENPKEFVSNLNTFTTNLNFDVRLIANSDLPTLGLHAEALSARLDEIKQNTDDEGLKSKIDESASKLSDIRHEVSNKLEQIQEEKVETKTTYQPPYEEQSVESSSNSFTYREVAISTVSLDLSPSMKEDSDRLAKLAKDAETSITKKFPGNSRIRVNTQELKDRMLQRLESGKSEAAKLVQELKDMAMNELKAKGFEDETIEDLLKKELSENSDYQQAQQSLNTLEHLHWRVSRSVVKQESQL